MIENPISRRTFVAGAMSAAIAGGKLAAGDPTAGPTAADRKRPESVTLRATRFDLRQPVRLVGTSTCDWQWNPKDSGSDWGYELKKKQTGGPSGIIGDVDPKHLPSFDQHSEAILARGKEIGCNTIRLSIDPARLCPRDGEFDEGVAAHYVRILAKCHRAGLEPLLTLNHWTLPKTFASYASDGRIVDGPLEHPRIVDYFAFYVRSLLDYLFDSDKVRAAIAQEPGHEDLQARLSGQRALCRLFITLNEPVNMVYTPYVLGVFPPYKRAQLATAPRLEDKLRAMHRIAYERIHDKAIKTQPREEQKMIKVGMAHAVTEGAVPGQDSLTNWGMIDRMENGAKSDFLGVQYYFRVDAGVTLGWPPRVTINGSDPRYWSDHPDFGRVDPAGVYNVLMKAAKKFPGKSLLLSEFGFADRTDNKRPDWILETVASVIVAKNEGAPVDGLLLWTLTDNFEWCQGMDMRFGLFDKDGNRLASDTGMADHVSSREVWTACCQHLRHPSADTSRMLSGLRARTREQLKRAATSSQKTPQKGPH